MPGVAPVPIGAYTHYRRPSVEQHVPDPVPIRFRSNSDPIPIRFRSNSDPIPIRFRYGSDLVPVLL